jgi:hypothetical protein
MAEKPEFKVINTKSLHGLSRREMVQRLFGGAGAALAIPGVHAEHPIHRHLASAALLDRADAQAAAADWSPAFLDAHQNDTLVVLSELIVPGSTKAQVNRFVDLLLSVDTKESRRSFEAALSAFEAEGLKQYNKPFKNLTEEQQIKILTDASTSGSPDANTYRRSRRYVLSDDQTPEPPAQSIRDHFENLKSWISGAYYSSEIGMRELGWTGNYFFESFPGCQHPEGHH